MSQNNIGLASDGQGTASPESGRPFGSTIKFIPFTVIGTVLALYVAYWFVKRSQIAISVDGFHQKPEGLLDALASAF